MRAGIVNSSAVAEVWPENETALSVFGDMQTQWRVAMGGPTGLDYAALPVVIEMHEVPLSQRRELFDCIRVMEGEALKCFAESRG